MSYQHASQYGLDSGTVAEMTPCSLRLDPPAHDCVQGGWVWWRSNRYDLAEYHRVTRDDHARRSR